MSTEEFLSRATKRVKKKSQVKEADIESTFVTYAKNNGCKAYKLIILNIKGFPDRTVLCPQGRVLFIEFKRKGKATTAPQVGVRKILESLGFAYHVCDAIGQAEQILDDFLEGL